MNITPNEKAEKIIAAISQAFGTVLLGQGISFHEANAIDDYASDEERKKARTLDTETHWWELPPDKLERFNLVLIYTDAEGFRFYIPAYMTLALRTYQSTSLSIDAAISSLFPVTSLHSKHYELLDDNQRKCIVQFLWFMATETNDHWYDKLNVYNATRGLEDLWYPYLEAREVP